MWLLVGLGNPDDKYKDNRHNVGFMVMDQIASDNILPAFKSKFNGCLLYTSPSPRDLSTSRMPSSA